MIMQAADLLARNKRPSEADIREELAANLGRCGTHVRIVRAMARRFHDGWLGRGATMNAITGPALARRSLLASGAGLFVAFATGTARGQTPTVAPGAPPGMAPGAPAGPAPTNLIDPPQVGVDGLLAIGADGRCQVLTSKTEFGQGIRASLAQIAAEELDLPYAMVEVPFPDTDRMPDHGLTGGSVTLQVVGPRVRRAAATARAALARMGAERLGVGPDAVETSDGVVRVSADPARSVS